MIKVTVITMGKLKEKYLKEACGEYIKRLSRYCSLTVEELTPVLLLENPSENEINAALEKEAALIEKRIPNGAYTVALCIEGKMLSSEELSCLVSEKSAQGKHLCFIIGSSYGIAERIKQLSALKLSVSAMTFPHQLFRVMLLEQIYRAFKISEGSAYHK